MKPLRASFDRLRGLRVPGPLRSVAAYLWALLVHWWRISPLNRRNRRPKQTVIKPYVRLDTLWRKFALVLTPIGLGLFCLVYGFFFALTAPYLTLFFAAPIGLLVLLSIWALPDRPHAPTKTLEFLFAATLICLILWPNYLALALPGLPWITAVRLTGTPMALIFLMCLSTSRPFRREVAEVASAIPGFWVWFLVFVIIQLATVALAKSPPVAINKAVIQQQNWTIMAAVAAWVCRVPGRTERYILILVLTTIPMFILQLLEVEVHHVLWAGNVPSFLKIDDATAISIFASQVRSATGLYRTKVNFPSALGMAEYVSLLTPFAIHYALNKYPRLLRVFGFALIPAIFYSVRLTDARLGVIAFLVSLMLYLLIWGMLRFRRNRRDLLAAAIIYALPALFAVVGGAVMFVGPVHTLVMGGGAQAASNAARQHQIQMALPKMLVNPIGHGGGGAGSAMGYGAGEFIAIDNYYLVMGLDYGMIGLVTFVGLFLLTIIWSIRAVLVEGDAADRETRLLIPLAVSMAAFLVIKFVFGQADLHAMMFMMMGMAVALVQRVKVRTAAWIESNKPRAGQAPSRRSRLVVDAEDLEEEDEGVGLPVPAGARRTGALHLR